MLLEPPEKPLPYLTNDIPGIGGVIKARAQDFVVEEIPLFALSGEGSFVHALIQKKKMSSLDAIARISRATGILRSKIGYAGLKDTRAITQQWMSFEDIDPSELLKLQIPRLEVLKVARHTERIRIGRLQGNRFTILIRNIDMPINRAQSQLEEIVAVLLKRGVPHYFGPQRFGNRFDSQVMGDLIIRSKIEELVDVFLGHPVKSDLQIIYNARAAYDQADYEKAYTLWPVYFNDRRRLLKTMVEHKNDKHKAYNILDRRLKRFFIAAFQSHMFNKVLAKRIDGIDTLMDGDLAWQHDDGTCFDVQNPQAKQDCCEQFEISPTGPLFGPNMLETNGLASQIEQPIFEAADIGHDEFERMKYYRIWGARRTLRFMPHNIQLSHGNDDLGDYLKLQFELDSGCYATVLLREITKTPDLL